MKAPVIKGFVVALLCACMGAASAHYFTVGNWIAWVYLVCAIVWAFTNTIVIETSFILGESAQIAKELERLKRGVQ